MAFETVVRGLPGRWILPDQRGFGGSDPIPAGSYPHFADLISDLDVLVEHIGGKVNLIGHSMGGSVALIYAAARPEKVHGLVLVEGLGALPQTMESPLGRVQEHLRGLRKPLRPIRSGDLDAATDRLRRRHPGLGPKHAHTLAIHGTRMTEKGRVWSFDPIHLLKGAYVFREEMLDEFLQGVEAPTMVIWATQSLYSKKIQEQRAHQIPNVRIETVDGGHMLPYDAPVKLQALILDHLSNADGTEPSAPSSDSDKGQSQ